VRYNIVIGRIKLFLILSILIVSTIPSAIGFSGSGFELDEDWSVKKRFLAPHSIIFDSNDNFYVSDSGNWPSHESIFKFSSDGKFLNHIIAEKPFSMTIDSRDNLYVVNRIGSEYVIDKMTVNGEVLSRYEKSNGYTIGVGNSLAIDSNDNLIIKSQGNLQKIDPNGKVVGVWELSEIPEIEKVGSGNIAIDSEDNLYFIGQGDGKITKIDSNQNYLLEWTIRKPANLIVGSDDTVFVNYGYPNSAVALFSSEGKSQGGLIPNLDIIFRDFIGINLDSKNSVYVVDKNNDTVIKFLKKTSSTIPNPENIEIASEPETQPQIDTPSLQIGVGSSDTSIQKIPEWVRNIFIWYAEDKVSEPELLNAIKYLVQQGIIRLD